MSVIIAWDVELSENVKAKPLQALRGETVILRPRFLERGKGLTIESDAEVKLYFRGSSGEWYAGADDDGEVLSESGRVSVKMLPADDDGGEDLEYRVGVNDGGRNYRAMGVIKWIDSPGPDASQDKNALQIIDWEAIENDNLNDAPFALKGGPVGYAVKLVEYSGAYYWAQKVGTKWVIPLIVSIGGHYTVTYVEAE